MLKEIAKKHGEKVNRTTKVENAFKFGNSDVIKDISNPAKKFNRLLIRKLLFLASKKILETVGSAPPVATIQKTNSLSKGDPNPIGDALLTRLSKMKIANESDEEEEVVEEDADKWMNSKIEGSFKIGADADDFIEVSDVNWREYVTLQRTEWPFDFVDEKGNPTNGLRDKLILMTLNASKFASSLFTIRVIKNRMSMHMVPFDSQYFNTLISYSEIWKMLIDDENRKKLKKTTEFTIENIHYDELEKLLSLTTPSKFMGMFEYLQVPLEYPPAGASVLTNENLSGSKFADFDFMDYMATSHLDNLIAWLFGSYICVCNVSIEFDVDSLLRLLTTIIESFTRVHWYARQAYAKMRSSGSKKTEEYWKKIMKDDRSAATTLHSRSTYFNDDGKRNIDEKDLAFTFFRHASYGEGTNKKHYGNLFLTLISCYAKTIIYIDDVVTSIIKYTEQKMDKPGLQEILREFTSWTTTVYDRLKHRIDTSSDKLLLYSRKDVLLFNVAHVLIPDVAIFSFVGTMNSNDIGILPGDIVSASAKERMKLFTRPLPSENNDNNEANENEDYKLIDNFVLQNNPLFLFERATKYIVDVDYGLSIQKKFEHKSEQENPFGHWRKRVTLHSLFSVYADACRLFVDNSDLHNKSDFLSYLDQMTQVIPDC
jgi:hypothetical protein